MPKLEKDERVLLLLGLLATQRQHGYQINEFIDRNLSRLSQMRKATAYALLNRLASAGYASVSTEQAGNRPVRRIYELTEAGAQLYDEMLRELLRDPNTVAPPGDIALMFIDRLRRDDAIAAIEARISNLDREIAELESLPPHEVGIGVDLSIGRRLALLRADRTWFASSLDRIREALPEESSVS